MIDEVAEFQSYTGTIDYKAKTKRDSAYLGRFTYDMLLEQKGFTRVLTVLARGYMWENHAKPNIDRARKALFAWCSLPESKKANPKEEWQYKICFTELHDVFPELVDENGQGWLYRHVHHVIDYVTSNPGDVMKQSVEKCEKLKQVFDERWAKKVIQFQTPLYSANTFNAWVLRFDDILADALEVGPLKDNAPAVPENVMQKALTARPDDLPEEVISFLLQFYYMNKQDDSDWVVLPEVNVDAYFGNANFSKKWAAKLPKDVFERQAKYGVCRFRVKV